MKVAILTSGVLPFPPVRGGAVENLIEFYIGDKQRGSSYDFTVLSLGDKNINQSVLKRYSHVYFVFFKANSWIRKIEQYRRLCLNKYFNIYVQDSYLKKAVAYLAKFKPDLIIVENRPEFILYLSDKINVDIILHLHNDSLNKDTNNAQEIVDACNKIWCVSDFIKKRVETIRLTNKIEVLFNAIDLEKFVPYSPNISLKRELGFDDSDYIIVFSGRISRAKGIRELIEAFISLKKSRLTNIKLLIVGSAFYGTNTSKNFFIKSLERILFEYRDDVCFTGFVSYDRIPEYLSLADVYVIPSIWDDPCPLTVFEGLAMGIPLIVSDSGGIPEIVTSECAIVVKRGAHFVMDLADSIANLKNDSNKRTQMSIAARERSLLFSKEKYCESFYRLLGER